MSAFEYLAAFGIVGLCIISEAFFAAAELSIVSANRIRLEKSAHAGSAAAARVLWFRDNPERLFGTTLIGTNLSTVTGSTVASLALLNIDPANGGWWALALMSPLILLGGEIIPKSLGQARATRVAETLAGPLRLVYTVLTPPIVLVRGYAGLLYRVLGVEEGRRAVMASREELVLLMEHDDATDGEIEADEREMISRIFAFSGLAARDSMVPLVEMVGIAADATVEQAVAIIAREGFSRLPVFRDRVDDISGILHHLDLFTAERPDQPVGELARPAYFVPESQEVDDILIILQREAASAAIVVDEFGGAVGLITLEDVLEEIVGEIHDEYDPQGRAWRPVDGGYIVNARAPVELLNYDFGLDLPVDRDYETIAGYVLEQLRRFPRQGEQLELPHGAILTVRRANDRAVLEVLLTGCTPRK